MSIVHVNHFVGNSFPPRAVSFPSFRIPHRTRELKPNPDGPKSKVVGPKQRPRGTNIASSIWAFPSIAQVRPSPCATKLDPVGPKKKYLNEEGYEGGLKRSEVDEILSAMESNYQTWAKSFAPPLIGVDHPDSIEKFMQDFLRMRPEIALSVGKMVFMSDFRDVLEKVEVPCTIAQCADDIVVPMSVAHYMQSKIKGRVSLEIIKSGHCPPLTAPQVLIDILDRVLISGN